MNLYFCVHVLGSLPGPGPEVTDKGHLGSSGVGIWRRGHPQSPINPRVEKPEQLGLWGELPHCSGQRRWRGEISQQGEIRVLVPSFPTASVTELKPGVAS